MIVSVMDEQGDRSPLSPEESLALIERTRSETRRALGWSGWQMYATWGPVWLVCFGLTHLIGAGPDAPLAEYGGGGIALVWLVGVVVGVGITVVHISHQARGVSGDYSRLGWRIGLAFSGVFSATSLLSDTLAPHPYQGALYVLVVAAVYGAMGAALLDDVQLWLGLWFLVITCVAVALGPAWVNATFALLGAAGFGVAAVVARARLRRGDG
jgi:hypothetical protein